MSVDLNLKIPLDVLLKLQNATEAELETDLDCAGKLSTLTTRAVYEAVKAHPSSMASEGDRSSNVSAKPNDDEMKVLIRPNIPGLSRNNPLLRGHPIYLRPSNTIEDLRVQIEVIIGVHPSCQNLWVGGNFFPEYSALEGQSEVNGDALTLRSLGIKSDAVIHWSSVPDLQRRGQRYAQMDGKETGSEERDQGEGNGKGDSKEDGKKDAEEELESVTSFGKLVDVESPTKSPIRSPDKKRLGAGSRFARKWGF